MMLPFQRIETKSTAAVAQRLSPLTVGERRRALLMDCELCRDFAQCAARSRAQTIRARVAASSKRIYRSHLQGKEFCKVRTSDYRARRARRESRVTAAHVHVKACASRSVLATFHEL